MFIDASGESNYEKSKNQNKLREQNLQKIMSVYDSFKIIDKYSYVATLDEIEGNDFNIDILRYNELLTVESKIEKYLNDLGF